MIATLIGAFVAILIGVSLVGPIATEVNTATSGNALGISSELLKLVPAFFVLIIIGIAISIVYNSLRNAGII